MITKRSTLIFLLALTAVSLFLCYLLFAPFIFPLVSATVIAIVFYPMHARVQRSIRKPSAAALVSTILVILIFVVPMALVLFGVKQEVATCMRSWIKRVRRAAGSARFCPECLNAQCNGSADMWTFRTSTLARS